MLIDISDNAGVQSIATDAYLLLSVLCNLLLLVDVIGEGLGSGDDCDGSLILQDVALSTRQHLNDFVLNLCQLASILSTLHMIQQ